RCGLGNGLEASYPNACCRLPVAFDRLLPVLSLPGITMTRHLPSLLIVALAMPSLARAEEKLTLKEVDAPPPAQLKEDFRKLLSDKAVQVLDANGQVKCDVWLRKMVPVKATEAQLQNGVTYQEVPPTTVFGVIRFPAA